MNKIKNIVFDFDGTLVDTAPLILHTMQETIHKMGLPSKTEKECRATIGLRLEEVPAVLWKELPEIGIEYAKTYRKIFDKLKRPLNVSCFPEVSETLYLLRNVGVRMAIASSRSHKSLEEYVELFGLTDCFTMLIGGNDVTKGKPSPDPVLAIINPLGWKAEETLTVGDAGVDIQMGKAAGTQTCAVTYGNGTERELEASHPDYTISNFRALTEIINFTPINQNILT
ncbi:MAG: HAD-IA family hydrolase [Bacteroides sp.]|nr:HAD-IA family hydrolase [Bacteroides sp.]